MNLLPPAATQLAPKSEGERERGLPQSGGLNPAYRRSQLRKVTTPLLPSPIHLAQLHRTTYPPGGQTRRYAPPNCNGHIRGVPASDMPLQLLVCPFQPTRTRDTMPSLRRKEADGGSASASRRVVNGMTPGARSVGEYAPGVAFYAAERRT